MVGPAEYEAAYMGAEAAGKLPAVGDCCCLKGLVDLGTCVGAEKLEPPEAPVGIIDARNGLVSAFPVEAFDIG